MLPNDFNGAFSAGTAVDVRSTVGAWFRKVLRVARAWAIERRTATGWSCRFLSIRAINYGEQEGPPDRKNYVDHPCDGRGLPIWACLFDQGRGAAKLEGFPAALIGCGKAA